MKKRKYTAIYKETKNGLYNYMVSTDYTNKENFSRDLRKNGYIVTAIFTDEQIENIQNFDSAIIFKYSERVCAFIRDCL